MVGQRQLQDVLEIVAQHRLPAPVRQAIGVQGDGHAAGDGEEPESRPGDEQRHERRHRRFDPLGLGAHQRVDDPAEQDRLAELGGRERHIGAGQEPSQAGLGTEQPEHAAVDAKEVHDGIFAPPG